MRSHKINIHKKFINLNTFTTQPLPNEKTYYTLCRGNTVVWLYKKQFKYNDTGAALQNRIRFLLFSIFVG